MKIKIPQIKNVIFFGNNQIYSNLIESLDTRKFSFVIISPSPVGELDNADVIVESDLEIALTKLDMYENSVGLSVGSPWIFSESMLIQLNNLIFNIHPSKLPENRGRAVPTWKILDQEFTNTVTLHQVTPVIDDGPIVESASVVLNEDSMPIDFEESSKLLAQKLITDFLIRYEDGGNCLLRPNLTENSSYWPGLRTSKQSYINWSWKCEYIKQFIHAFSDPYRGGQTFVGKSRVYIRGKVRCTNDDGFHPFKIGIIYKKHENAYSVACKAGTLKIPVNCVTYPGGDKANLCIGDRFYTPHKLLLEAKSIRFTNRDINPEVY